MHVTNFTLIVPASSFYTNFQKFLVNTAALWPAAQRWTFLRCKVLNLSKVKKSLSKKLIFLLSSWVRETTNISWETIESTLEINWVYIWETLIYWYTDILIYWYTCTVYETGGFLTVRALGHGLCRREACCKRFLLQIATLFMRWKRWEGGRRREVAWLRN
jgi:hypothetical protein